MRADTIMFISCYGITFDLRLYKTMFENKLRFSTRNIIIVEKQIQDKKTEFLY